MKRWPKIKRVARVQFTTDEFINCVEAVEAAMQRTGTRDPRFRLEAIGQYFGDVEKGMAFAARMECMFEMQSSPRGAEFVTPHEGSQKVTLSLGMLHAAALAPLHYDDDSQFFDEKEFFGMAELEKRALIAAS
jgi:hypothetical protein